MKLTIFTPVFNRGKYIVRVYNSLCSQSIKDFEWLIINDGSTDDTNEKINELILNHKESFIIRYYKQENLGLNRTINKALELANGNLFCRLDSDDYALENLVEKISKNYSLIENNQELCAMVFLSQKPNGEINGFHPFNETRRSNFNEYRDKYKALGDRSEVVKTSIFKQFKFPEFEGEKFITEGIVWVRMATKFDAIYINEPIYVKEDSEDSITKKIYYTNKKCCKGSTLFFYEVMNNLNFSFKFRLIHSIKYYRYAFFAKANIFKGIPISMILIGLPLGILVTLHDFIKYK